MFKNTYRQVDGLKVVIWYGLDTGKNEGHFVVTDHNYPKRGSGIEIQIRVIPESQWSSIGWDIRERDNDSRRLRVSIFRSSTLRVLPTLVRV